jgi:uncharacterized protein
MKNITMTLTWKSVFDNVYVWLPLILIADLIILFIPFHLWLKDYFTFKTAKEIGGILQCGIRISLVIFFIKQLSLQRTFNFHSLKVSNPQFLLIPFVFPLLLAIPNFKGIGVNDFLFTSVLVTCFYILLMAAAEEFLMRGLVLSALLKKFGTQHLLKAVIISSLLFSLMHLINLYKDNLATVFVQLIFAFYFGVFFGAIMLKTRNLIFISFIHGIINICFDLDTVLNRTVQKKYAESWFEIFKSILTTSLILCPLFFIGYFIIRKMQKQEDNQLKQERANRFIIQ